MSQLHRIVDYYDMLYRSSAALRSHGTGEPDNALSQSGVSTDFCRSFYARDFCTGCHIATSAIKRTDCFSELWCEPVNAPLMQMAKPLTHSGLESSSTRAWAWLPHDVIVCVLRHLLSGNDAEADVAAVNAAAVLNRHWRHAASEVVRFATAPSVNVSMIHADS